MLDRACIVGVAAILAAAPSMLAAYRVSDDGKHAGSTATDGDNGSQWVEDKYERLSSLVPLTNWFRFGDPEASATMHAALWNGTAWDLQLSNRMVNPASHHPPLTTTLTLPLTLHVILPHNPSQAVNASLDILLGRDKRLQMHSTEGSSTGAAVRVLDAGTGWGGTIFFAEAARAAAARDAEAARAADAARAAAAGTDDAEAARTANAAMFATLDLPLVRYDGLTLSPTQARQANADAARKGLGATARFHVRSFDAVLPSPDPYAVVFAIESLEHSPDLDATLGRLSRALLPGGVLVVLTDVRSEPAEREGGLGNLREGDLGNLLADYQAHWCAPRDLNPGFWPNL